MFRLCYFVMRPNTSVGIVMYVRLSKQREFFCKRKRSVSLYEARSLYLHVCVSIEPVSRGSQANRQAYPLFHFLWIDPDCVTIPRVMNLRGRPWLTTVCTIPQDLLSLASWNNSLKPCIVIANCR